MKKVLALAFAMICVAAISASAADGKHEKKPLTDEQKAEMKAMTEKYDADKDGKLSKEEREKMSQEDKDKMRKIFGGGEKGKGEKKKH